MTVNQMYEDTMYVCPRSDIDVDKEDTRVFLTIGLKCGCDFERECHHAFEHFENSIKTQTIVDSISNNRRP